MRNSIGENIRRLRMKKKMSLNGLAGLADVSPSYLCTIESGKHTNISITILKKLSSALCVDIKEIIGE
jgi:transcriptional regulator with XRE-family HTH domain